jgi:hypothetical protein
MAATDEVRIFISYGRKDATLFVDRLEGDLKRAGYTVFRDVADLKVSRPWDEQLDSAVKHSNMVLAVLTPHAVRTTGRSAVGEEESVCLDELAVARFRRPPTPIVPLMLIQCEPPFIICRLQYLDFANAEGDEVRYKGAFEELLRTINGVKDGSLVPDRKLDFKPQDFDLYLNTKTREFTGRQWLVSDILAYLADADAPPVLLLAGDPGWGKTAFAGHLFSADPGGLLLAAHFCRADRADTLDRRRFVESLAAMTALRVPEYRQRLHDLVEHDPRLLTEAPEVLIERLFLEQLGELDRAILGHRPRYILVDGLDESVSPGGASGIQQLLVQASNLFPDWLRLIATTRDAFGIVETFRRAKVVRLRADDPRNRADIKHLIDAKLPLSDVASNKVNKLEDHQGLCQVIEVKAEGNALIASQLAGAMHQRGLDGAALDQLPRGLSALYRALLERRFDSKGALWARAREVLSMVTAVSAPLPVSLAATALGDAGEYETRETVEKLSEFFHHNENDTIQLFHKSFSEFLADRKTPFFVNRMLGAQRVAVAFGKVKPKRGSPYELLLPDIISTIISSVEPAIYKDQLPTIYNHLFSRDVELYRGPSQEELDLHGRLIDVFVNAGHGTLLSQIPLQGLETSIARFRDSRASLWMRDQSRPKPDGSVIYEIAKDLQAICWIAEFVLFWTEHLSQLCPDCRAKLRETYSRPLFGFYDWLGASASSIYGLSGYYSDKGFWIYAESERVRQSLE